MMRCKCTPLRAVPVHYTQRRAFRGRAVDKMHVVAGSAGDYTQKRALQLRAAPQMHVDACSVWRPHAMACISAASGFPDARGCALRRITSRIRVHFARPPIALRPPCPPGRHGTGGVFCVPSCCGRRSPAVVISSRRTESSQLREGTSAKGRQLGFYRYLCPRLVVVFSESVCGEHNYQNSLPSVFATCGFAKARRNCARIQPEPRE